MPTARPRARPPAHVHRERRSRPSPSATPPTRAPRLGRARDAGRERDPRAGSVDAPFGVDVAAAADAAFRSWLTSLRAGAVGTAVPMRNVRNVGSGRGAKIERTEDQLRGDGQDDG